MTITGDVISSGNMDLIGSINGNIEINGKLNITGNINGNSSAAEIYAESAQINGEVKSKGSVKIGQSSVVIGNILQQAQLSQVLLRAILMCMDRLFWIPLQLLWATLSPSPYRSIMVLLSKVCVHSAMQKSARHPSSVM